MIKFENSTLILLIYFDIRNTYLFINGFKISMSLTANLVKDFLRYLFPISK
jgi:hypothetical protein